jgi:FtsZ-binding cell division protein ZapB
MTDNNDVSLIDNLKDEIKHLKEFNDSLISQINNNDEQIELLENQINDIKNIPNENISSVPIENVFLLPIYEF